MGVSGLTQGHQRSTWCSLDLRSPGASITSAHLPLFLLPPVHLLAGGPVAGDFSGHLSFNFCLFVIRRGHLTCFRARIQEKSGRKFLELSVINNGKRTLLSSHHAGMRGVGQKSLTLLLRLLISTFLGSAGALSRPLPQVTLADGVVSPPPPPPPPPGCCPKCGFTGEPECFLPLVPHDVATTPSRNVIEAAKVDRGTQRVVTKHGVRATSSVSTQVYSRRNSEADTSSPSLEEATSFNPALFEAIPQFVK
ncbi:hypothetical protein Cgig2_000833 [Carnegiea gigantea]|uniref:Uncharacterized protein n=1 Tax=Carnegiea gigantea TaxID=171969 RepID=A0A9Q1QJW4_9CARY|nr:hypothetical protein Cgig2_000833 [Carnegiea gigantea]